jgi:hypothetical protein
MTNAVNIAQSGSNNQTMRNRIINGAMTIDQRNAGASVAANGGFYLDRWEIEASQSGKLNIQQQTSVVPAGFNYAMALTSLSSYTVGSSETFNIKQIIEGFNASDLAWGTANAQPATLSFWVRSSLTGTFGGALQNGDNDRSYPFSYTISAANTFEYKTITVPGDTTGTWGKTNGRGIQIRFSLGNGSTFSGTANAWVASDIRTVTGATSVVGTNGATFYITGVQFEEGTAASPFENRLYGQELALCQRYFAQYQGDNGTYAGITGYAVNGTDAFFTMGLPVAMRTSPTGALNGTARFVSGSFDSANFTALSATLTVQTPFNSLVFSVTTSGMTANAGGTFQFRATGSKLTFSAEL